MFIKPPDYQKGAMNPDCKAGCVFCRTTDPTKHVKFCGGCKKCICDDCRPKWTMRGAAAVDENVSKVTKVLKRVLY